MINILKLRQLQNVSGNLLLRQHCRQSTNSGGSPEKHLESLLHQRFPKATIVEVQDVSGGCGAMYLVNVEAPDFKGLSRVRQHMLITKTLSEQIKDMHGLRINTSVPKDG